MDGQGLIWSTVIIILLTIPLFYLSLTNYYYLDEEGIHYNSLTSLKEKEYKWDELKKVHVVYRNHQGTTGLLEYMFEGVDGSIITIPYNDKLAEHKWRVEDKIEENKNTCKRQLQQSDNGLKEVFHQDGRPLS